MNMKHKVVAAFVFLLASLIPNRGCAEELDPSKPKNVIMMIMDGTNSDVVSLSRWYKGGPLALDEILVGGVKTYSLRSAITDSAAAGTAMATGNKTIVDAIGMVPTTGKRFKPVRNLVEAAREAGYATGIVSTSQVQHATPAAYSSHVTNRENFDDIAEQQVYGGLDVVLGGGKRSLVSKNRKDGEDLLGVVKDRGFQFVQTRAELLAARSDKLWGSFADEALSNHFDRAELTPEQPTLAEMTGSAIQVLSGKDDGFFLFVEGSKIDWAAHKNDPVGMVSEVLGFDEAVRVAVNFAKKDGNTLVVAVTDHGNSGLTIGSKSTDKTYAVSSPEKFVEPLKKAKLTLEGALAKGASTREIASDYGLTNLTWKEWLRLKMGADTEADLTQLLAMRAHIGFTTKGHTGEDVFLYAYGPNKPSGLIENTDIPKHIARFLDLRLDVNAYVRAQPFFEKKGYKVQVDVSDQENPVLVMEKEGERLEYPENKSYYFKNGAQVQTPAPNVYNGEEFYITEP